MRARPRWANSLFANKLALRITDADFFKILLSTFTKEPQLLGPLDMNLFRNSVFRFMTEGYLPAARVVFLDEIWRCSSAALNTLPGILNEREFRNGAEMEASSVSSMFCAANDPPRGADLAALYDRIDLRYHVEPIRDRANLVRLLKLDIDPEPEPILSWAEIVIAQALAAAMPVPDEVHEAVVDVYLKLLDLGIQPTGRRLRKLTRILQAEAWLDGADEVEVRLLSSPKSAPATQSDLRGVTGGRQPARPGLASAKRALSEATAPT